MDRHVEYWISREEANHVDVQHWPRAFSLPSRSGLRPNGNPAAWPSRPCRPLIPVRHKLLLITMAKAIMMKLGYRTYVYTSLDIYTKRGARRLSRESHPAPLNQYRSRSRERKQPRRPVRWPHRFPNLVRHLGLSKRSL
jgi:hypothetical protein